MVTYNINDGIITYIVKLGETNYGYSFKSKYDLKSKTGILLQHLEYIQHNNSKIYLEDTWTLDQRWEWILKSQKFKEDIMYELLSYL